MYTHWHYFFFSFLFFSTRQQTVALWGQENCENNSPFVCQPYKIKITQRERIKNSCHHKLFMAMSTINVWLVLKLGLGPREPQLLYKSNIKKEMIQRNQWDMPLSHWKSSFGSLRDWVMLCTLCMSKFENQIVNEARVVEVWDHINLNCSIKISVWLYQCHYPSTLTGYKHSGTLAHN